MSTPPAAVPGSISPPPTGIGTAKSHHPPSQTAAVTSPPRTPTAALLISDTPILVTAAIRSPPVAAVTAPPPLATSTASHTTVVSKINSFITPSISVSVTPTTAVAAVVAPAPLTSTISKPGVSPVMLIPSPPSKRAPPSAQYNPRLSRRALPAAGAAIAALSPRAAATATAAAVTERKQSDESSKPASAAASVVDHKSAAATPAAGSVVDSPSKSKREKRDELKYADIVFGDRIGEGAFSEVYRGTLYGQEVAVKTLKGLKRDDIKEFKQEVKIMRSLRHPNVVEYLGACFVKPNLCIVTEYLAKGSLEAMIERKHKAHKKMSIKFILRVAKDIARGLNWLHHKGIIHRDLKPANILVDRNNTLKIADFGLSHVKSRPNDGGFYGVCGTPCYMAPEVLSKKRYGTRADVFSFGIVLCELVTGHYPYENAPNAPVKTMLFEHAIVSGLRPPIPADCLPALAELMRACWREEAADRPDSDQIFHTIIKIQEQLGLAAAEDVLDDVPDEVRKLFETEKKRVSELETAIAIEKKQLETAMHNLRSTERALVDEKQARRELDKRFLEFESEMAKQELFRLKLHQKAVDLRRQKAEIERMHRTLRQSEQQTELDQWTEEQQMTAATDVSTSTASAAAAATITTLTASSGSIRRSSGGIRESVSYSSSPASSSSSGSSSAATSLRTVVATTTPAIVAPPRATHPASGQRLASFATAAPVLVVGAKSAFETPARASVQSPEPIARPIAKAAAPPTPPAGPAFTAGSLPSTPTRKEGKLTAPTIIGSHAKPLVVDDAERALSSTSPPPASPIRREPKIVVVTRLPPGAPPPPLRSSAPNSPAAKK